MHKRPATARHWHVATGIAGLLAGLFFYTLARHPQANIYLPDAVIASFPSFIHMLVLIALTFAIRNGHQDTTARTVTLLFFVSLLAELLLGYFDLRDVLALVLGTVTGVALGCTIQAMHRKNLVMQAAVPAPAVPRRQWISSVPLFCLSLVMINGSYYGPYNDDDYYKGTSAPIYLSYTELRNSVAVTDAIELQSIGRLYLFGNHVFLNRRNEGIHVIDNSDPRNPVNASFITIPGNTEISIRSGFLYADSYVDLVTLDVRDIGNIQEINRQTDIFPWDAYQNVPDDVYFSSLDSTRGVVTSYVR